jgi:predicted nucleic-acid-binding protein
MIGFDTHIPLRLFVDDTEPARHFIAENADTTTFFISLIVLVEFAWTLRNRDRFSRIDVQTALSSSLSSDDFLVENAMIVNEANGPNLETSTDFPDALVALSGREAGCRSTVTLDAKSARRLSHMEALS